MLNYSKTRELVYALMRISVSIRNVFLKEKINYWALQLLEDITLKNYEQAINNVALIRELLEFGRGILEIELVNADTVLKELEVLDSAIRQLVYFAGLPEVESMLSKKNGDSNNNVEDDGGSLNATIRQSAILEKIRQFAEDSCQIKDLMVCFPDVSERTIRYDLQKLHGSGLIERVGNGSSTGYVIK